MAILNDFTNSALGLSGKTPQKYNQVSKLLELSQTEIDSEFPNSPGYFAMNEP